MSGICGIVALDGSPSTSETIAGMTRHLQRRGPDGTHYWYSGQTAFGHALLATTPEALVEVLPLSLAETGCTITADARLDNRETLVSKLGLADQGRTIGDGELILCSYLKWGDDCVHHLLGDFAFAVWDARKQRLFCARDPIGVRQLTYTHLERRCFIFATEPAAILQNVGVARRINERRVADFLDELEGADFSSTFYEGIFRLPPAHCLVLDAKGLAIRRYWELVPPPELHLASNEAYAEAFLEVFTTAVGCRLRSPGPVGAMLSGGMDSGSIVAVASRLLASQGLGPLQTISAVAPDPDSCVETRAIRAALEMPGISPTLLSYGELTPYLEELTTLTQNLDEPFDGTMTLMRLVYIQAHRAGLKVVLDGGGGDIVMNPSTYIARLLAKGKAVAAIREARGLTDFDRGGMALHGRILVDSMWRAFVPSPLRLWRKRMLLRIKRDLPRSRRMIAPKFAERIGLGERWQEYESHVTYSRTSLAEDRANPLSHPNSVAGQERYDRVASSCAIEARDPFTDLRVISFCLSLPGEQLLANGWPKIIMRRAMKGLLPPAVLERRGKEHLGWAFTESYFSQLAGWGRRLQSGGSSLLRYVDARLFDERDWASLGASERLMRIDGYLLLNWLENSGKNHETE